MGRTMVEELHWLLLGKAYVYGACTTFSKNRCKTLQRTRQATERGAHHFFPNLMRFGARETGGAFAASRVGGEYMSPQMNTDGHRSERPIRGWIPEKLINYLCSSVFICGDVSCLRSSPQLASGVAALRSGEYRFASRFRGEKCPWRSNEDPRISSASDFVRVRHSGSSRRGGAESGGGGGGGDRQGVLSGDHRRSHAQYGDDDRVGRRGRGD